MKRLPILAGSLTLTVAAFAQISPLGSHFQQPGWIAAPGSGPINYPTLPLDAQSGPVTGKPFSGTETRRSVQTLADGTHVEDASTSLFYRDAQGRMRSESPKWALIYDGAGGFTYSLDLHNKFFQKNAFHNSANTTVSIAAIGNRTSISTHSSSNQSTQSHGEMAPGKKEHRALVSSIHSQAVTEDLTPQMVNGVFCRGSRTTETIPAHTFGNDRDVKITSERWYSDDLQVLVKTSNSDPRFGVTTYELTNIVQAPPDPALFQIPADFSPSPGVAFHGAGGVPNQK